MVWLSQNLFQKKKADAKLSDGNEKCADEETTVNKILTNTEPSQGDIYSGDTSEI